MSAQVSDIEEEAEQSDNDALSGTELKITRPFVTGAIVAK